eukprot:TRINITY_DN14081_c0_g1_i2.p1 TRINITY_DN14081_c0_g1~~TRINITY_DN14081_c0_g1_i2.p1  ORF type:complete len:380 (+),score=99.51 TRINITY_DN14081_c0_g1_i2:464-1603(+)
MERDAELLSSVLDGVGGASPGPARLCDLLMQIEVNCYGVSPKFVSLGEAVYPRAAVFNHSCAPNATAAFRGTRLCVHALRKIACGEEVCITYCFVGQARAVRRRELKEGHFFDCLCERCVEDELERPGVEALAAASAGRLPGVELLRQAELLLKRGIDTSGKEVFDHELFAPSPGAIGALAGITCLEDACPSGIPPLSQLQGMSAFAVMDLAKSRGLSGLSGKGAYVAALDSMRPPGGSQLQLRRSVRDAAAAFVAAKQQRSPPAVRAALAQLAAVAPPPSLLVTVAGHEAALMHHAARDPAGAVLCEELSLPGFIRSMPRHYPPLGLKLQLYAEALTGCGRTADAERVAAEALRSLRLVYPPESPVVASLQRSFPQLF